MGVESYPQLGALAGVRRVDQPVHAAASLTEVPVKGLMHRVGHFTVRVWRGQAQVDCGVTWTRLGSSRVSQGWTKGQVVRERGWSAETWSESFLSIQVFIVVMYTCTGFEVLKYNICRPNMKGTRRQSWPTCYRVTCWITTKTSLVLNRTVSRINKSIKKNMG